MCCCWSSWEYNIIDLKDHSYALSGKSKSTDRHKGWLNNILVKHVHNGILADIDTCEFLSVDVSVSELSDEVNGVHTGVLSKGVRNKFKGFSVKSDTVWVSSDEGSGVFLELLGNFHLDGSTTWDEGSSLDEGSNDTEGIMEWSLGLVKDQLVGTSQ